MTTTEPRACNRCGGPVTSAGRRSASGLYWCRDLECQAAKQRHNYAEFAGDRPDAPTICSGCGAGLTPRKVRRGDSPTGLRWCNRPACRNDRAVRERKQAMGTPLEPELAKRLEYLHRALSQPRVTCPECGREDCVDGPYPHYDLRGVRCAGLGNEWVHVDDVKATFPNYGGLPSTLAHLLP